MVRLAKQNNGIRRPEMRLWLGYPAAILSSLGLLIWGLSIDRNWHWITGQVAFFLCEFSPSIPFLVVKGVLTRSSRGWVANGEYCPVELYRR